MTLSIAIPACSNQDAANEWSYLAGALGVTEVYYYGTCQGWPPSVSKLIPVADLSWLVGNVCMAQPTDGVIVQGTIDLRTYTHPDPCTYVFGPNHLNFDPAIFGGAVTPDYVYIPSQGLHLYSWQAAGIVLYDRLVKNG